MKTKKETVKVMKMSRYSYGVVIPKEFMRDLKWFTLSNNFK